jgi:hypothetical protein
VVPEGLVRLYYYRHTSGDQHVDQWLQAVNTLACSRKLAFDGTIVRPTISAWLNHPSSFADELQHEAKLWQHTNQISHKGSACASVSLHITMKTRMSGKPSIDHQFACLHVCES